MLPFKVPNSMEEAIQLVPNPREDETLPARVKEVYVMFDSDNNGFLTIDELEKLLKKLSGFTNDQIAAFCSDIDKSKDGKVSYRELVDWVRKGGGAGAGEVAKAIIRETNKRAVRIKAAFDRYDESSDGSLDLAELTTVLRTLGAFTNHEIRQVLADLDSNGDGDISFPEFANWVRRANDVKAVIKAKCILAPSDSDGIEAVFYNFCGPGHADLDGKSFQKLMLDCKLLNKALTKKYVDLIFSDNRVKHKHQRRIDYPQFETALELVAEKRGSTLEEVRNALLMCTHPVLKGTKADYVRFHDDVDGQKEAAKVGADGSQPKKPERKPKRMPGDLPVGIPADPFAVTVDNTKLWKVFGADNEAGRCLKRVYSPCSPQRSVTKCSFRANWPPAMDIFVAVNTLGVAKHGVRFRRSMYLSDTCPDPLAVLPWGSSIKGELVASCWLKVGKQFLPTSINGVQVMKRWTAPRPPPSPHTPVIRRSSSLPSIRDTEKAFDLNGMLCSLAV